jgi:cytochrome b pre-mRNA-processing protein 3
MLRKLFERKPKPSQILYGQIVAAARRENFYTELEVPDTVEGRFDMIVVHMFLVLNRLKDEPDKTLAQDLVDEFFADMDRSLREMGVGDIVVGKKVRKIAESFYGRIDAYRTALSLGHVQLTDALARNVYATTKPIKAPALADWMRRATASLGTQSLQQLEAGQVEFTT